MGDMVCLKIIRVSGLVLLASACTPIADSTYRLNENMQESSIRLQNKFAELLTYHPPSKEKKPVKPTYCYQVMQDILCYAKPRRGAGQRLVAYQGPAEEAAELASAEMPEVSVSKTKKEEVSITPPAGVEASPGSSVGRASDPGRTERSMRRFANMKPLVVEPMPVVAAEEQSTPKAEEKKTAK